MAPLLIGSDHAEGNGPEEPVETNDNRVQNGKNTPANLLVQAPRCPIKAEAHSQDREPQRRVVVVDVGDTAHSHEGKIVEDPTDDGVDSGVVDLVNIGLLKVVVTALPADNVPDYDKTKDAETGCAAPVDEGITEEEVLNNYKSCEHGSRV